jgi:hypothetical protein
VKTIAKFLSCILITLGTAAVIIQVLFMFGWAEKAVGWRAIIAVIVGTTVSFIFLKVSSRRVLKFRSVCCVLRCVVGRISIDRFNRYSLLGNLWYTILGNIRQNCGNRSINPAQLIIHGSELLIGTITARRAYLFCSIQLRAPMQGTMRRNREGQIVNCLLQRPLP